MKTSILLRLRRCPQALGFVFALSAVVVLGIASCGGGPKALDATPPNAIGPLARNWLLQDGEARASIAALHGEFEAPGRAWVASYGENDRIVIYAAGFPDPVGAETAVGSMRAALAKGDTPFGTAKEISIAQQGGYQAGGLDTDHFFFAKGNWVVWVQAIARDFDPAVNSINWAPAP